MLRASATVEAQEARKARGAFFTPPELCRYMAEWAIRGPTDRVLEPSCGEAAFLLAAAERLTRPRRPDGRRPARSRAPRAERPRGA